MSDPIKRNPERVMLSSMRRQALGSVYSLVGSHSAVKLCRWQKSMMRGYGGCYKWTFYGIESHRCMEATPSMACANKCIFCWRGNTNPTTKDWHWKQDQPQEIVDGLLSSHQALIRKMKGVPGATKERYEEALVPRHCALSLVGEPILYPRINALLGLLHKKHISTFLVQNGQFPERIPTLHRVTQLYLSVDAPNPEVMKKLDRPIFSDFWHRFQQSLDSMAERKNDRKVFRMTMIEGYNMSPEDLLLYRELLLKGKPDLIEIKQLTPAFQGRSQSLLRMENVPKWSRLVDYSKALCQTMKGTPLDYEVACTHEHSKCILLARKSIFYRDGQWHTWIDFEKFHQLIESGKDDFSLEDYMRPTPSWAVAGSMEEGFDPSQERRISPKRRAHLEKERQKEVNRNEADQ